MHSLKPNGKYRIVTVVLTVADEVDNSTLSDCLNETLRPMLDWVEPRVIADYSFDLNLIEEVQVSADPEEQEADRQVPTRRKLINTIKDLIEWAAYAGVDGSAWNKALEIAKTFPITDPDHD